MTTQHTLGPWQVDNERPCFIRTEARTALAEVMSAGCHCASCDATLQANARLIAAAPDLLAALEALTHCIAEHQGGADILPFDATSEFPEDRENYQAVMNAKTAIAQAKGQ